ncbi:UDP-4-amino-4,6-dideoxy-N-acetyl-beta-L-altrosamine N-acetyltransferase [bacterium]|nr:MAG: UDP-4-amino-4,6-dideoxy-N-acetyl-beta-L-altrosamine N-acetyltransferase [bacterium]
MSRIEFGPVSESDLGTILAWRNSEGIRKFMYQDRIITPNEHSQWFSRMKSDKTKKYWLMHLDGRPAGVVNLDSIDYANKTCEWAFYIGEPWALGSPLGRVAEFQTIDFVFLNLGLEKLCCAVLAFNKAVINMHKGFGFLEEGVRRSQILRGEGRVDVVLLGLTRDQWLANRNAIREQKLKPLPEYSFAYTDGTPVLNPA